jgi:hypothetical protein
MPRPSAIDPGGNHQHLGPGVGQRHKVGNQRVQPGALQAAVLHQQGGADLDDDPVVGPQAAGGGDVGLHGHQGCQPSCSGAGTWLAASSLSLSMARTIMRSARSTLRPLAEDRIRGFWPQAASRLAGFLGDQLVGERVAFRQRHDLRLVGDRPHRPPVRRARSGRLRPGLPRPRSTRCSSTRVRSTWPRKRSPRPVRFVGALDQAGNIGHARIRVAIDLDDAEIGMQRRERIVGDLRLGGRNGRQEGRLAGIGQADQAGVGDQLQP